MIMIIEKEKEVNKNNYKVAMDTKTNNVVFTKNNKVIVAGKGLWQQFNILIDKNKDTVEEEIYGILTSDIDLEISM